MVLVQGAPPVHLTLHWERPTSRGEVGLPILPEERSHPLGRSPRPTPDTYLSPAVKRSHHREGAGQGTRLERGAGEREACRLPFLSVLSGCPPPCPPPFPPAQMGLYNPSPPLNWALFSHHGWDWLCSLGLSISLPFSFSQNPCLYNKADMSFILILLLSELLIFTFQSHTGLQGPPGPFT